MLMQYWQKELTGIIYGFDLSDTKQVTAMSQLVNYGQWNMLTDPPTGFVISKEQNKNYAVWCLQETDWVNQPDVYDPTQPSYLLNRQDFITYRTAIRTIVLDPPEGIVDWPIVPVAQWSS